jgi:hypothetical protein
MRAPQVVVYDAERDSRLAELLRGVVALRRWALHTTRSADSCLRLLRGGGPGVVVVRGGPDLKTELGLLERCAWLYPDVPAVVVSDGENPPWAGLAWDLGARCVLPLAQARGQLPEVVAGLMEPAARPPGREPPRPAGREGPGHE